MVLSVRVRNRDTAVTPQGGCVKNAVQSLVIFVASFLEAKHTGDAPGRQAERGGFDSRFIVSFRVV